MGDDQVFGPGTSWSTASQPLSAALADGINGVPSPIDWYQVGGIKVSSDDKYWTNVLDEARRVYGDNGIQYVNDGGTRRLAFGDGKYLPEDGRIAYSSYDAAGNLVHHVQDDRGAIRALDDKGKPTGAAIVPDEYRYDPASKQIVGYKGGRAVYAAPSDSFTGPNGEKSWEERDGKLVPSHGNSRVPGSELLGIQPKFPGWVDGSWQTWVTTVFASLRLTLGSGTPAVPTGGVTPGQVPPDPAGIPEYGDLKVGYHKLKTTYDQVNAKMIEAVTKSAELTEAARREVTDAVHRFNSTAAALVEDDYVGLFGAVSSSLEQAKSAIEGLLAKQISPGSYLETAYIPSAARVPTLPPPQAGLPDKAVDGARTAFRNKFGRDPKTLDEWVMGNALDPKTYDPKTRGADSVVQTFAIKPQPGKGVVRTNAYIPAERVNNPLGRGGGQSLLDTVRELDVGDNRQMDATVTAANSRVSFFIDYERGLVVARQNPSVPQSTGGMPRAETPRVTVTERPNGVVNIDYLAVDPFQHSLATAAGVGVEGSIDYQAKPSGVIGVDGTVTQYPSLEVYQYTPDGNIITVAQRHANSGGSFGPMVNLPLGPTQRIVANGGVG